MTRFHGRLGASGPDSRQFAIERDSSAQNFSAPNFTATADTAQERQWGGEVDAGLAVAWVGRPRLGNEVLTPSLFRATLARQASPSLLLEKLTGPFAIAWYDSVTNSGVVATDRMGIEPVFVVETGSTIGFGSEPGTAVAAAGRRPQVDPQALFDYLFCHVVPAPHAVFRGARRLLPGECVEFSEGRSAYGRYWSPCFQEDRNERFEELRDRFRSGLRDAVATAVEGSRCGTFLSGGTDSSTIAGLLTQITGEPVPTFSIGFDAQGFDEMEYARLAARHFGTRHHEYYVTPDDIVDAVPQLAALHGQPFGNSSSVPAYFCAKLARETGVDCMLAGDGGDELFGGNARYARQHVFSHYERVPTSLRHGVVEPACRSIGRLGRVPGISKVVSYVEQASVPMPARLETYNLLNRIGIDEILAPEFAAHIDRLAPERLNRDAYMNPTARTLINRMLALDFKTTLADNDLPKVMESCRLAGVEVAFPMLDHRVVDFSLALAPELKLKGTQLRYFFKEALRGFLPDAIIRKQKHGFGLPFGEWAMRHPRLRDMTFEALNRFKQRGWVRANHLDKLKDELLPAMPNYYGSLAWLYMTLELWMQSHIDRNGQGY